MLKMYRSTVQFRENLGIQIAHSRQLLQHYKTEIVHSHEK